MSNLVNYVIKYSTDRSTIRIRTELRDDLFTITLATPAKLTGEDDLDSVCDMFYRVTNEQAPRIPCAGLGINICQRIVSSHGGEIDAPIDGAGDFVVEFRLPIIDNEPATV
jgi:K+-sensing histidine kinase KdpD